MSILKVDTINTSDGTGNITVSRPLSGSGASLTALPAASLTGTIADARFPATLPAISGANLTNLPGGGATVYISSVAASNVATVDFLTSFSSTYDVYICRYCDVVPATDGAYFGLRIAHGGVAQTTAQYHQTTTNRRTDSDTAGNGETGSAEFDIHLNGSGSASGEHTSGDAVFYNPLSTSSHKSVGWRNANVRDNGNYCHNIGAGSYWSTTATTGFQFKFSSGNVASGTFRLYGIANS